MCADWAHLGLQINALAPGYFDTKLTEALVNDGEFSAWLAMRTPQADGGAPRNSSALLFLSSSASGFVNGQILYLDGGLTAVV